MAELNDGRPFATLEDARDAVRELKTTSGLPTGGLKVRVRSGVHTLAHGVRFGPEDSGTAAAPIVYCPAEGETVRLLGGRQLDPAAWTPVTEPAVRARLAEGAKEHVVQIDLASQGVTDLGTFVSRGFGRDAGPAHLELFFNDLPMTVAQWPNAGQFAEITGFTKPVTNPWGQEAGDLTGGFTYDGDRPSHWAPANDIWVHGYWGYDWANSYERVSRLDPENRLVETAPPHGNHHFTPGQRFYFLNVLEELDQPGEYYVDQTNGILYFWPPGELSEAEAVVSEVSEPLMTLQDVSHVELRGLTVEAGRGSGIEAEGGEGLRIIGCTIRNCGTWAVRIEGGTNHTVAGCDIYGCGDGGVSVNGGDRPSLTPCNHAVVNNHIHHFARWTRCYVAGIGAGGVGMRFAHNLIHDAPHNAILFWGNDFLIEHNEIYRVCLETGDAGAIYTGRDYTYRGNVIRRNFIHHMGGVGMGTMAIYMDDCVSGTHIAENTLWHCQTAVVLGGGRDFVVEQNVFVECLLAIGADARGISTNPVWQNNIKGLWESLKAIRYNEPPYSEHYPEIAGVDPHYAAGKGVPPEHNRVERNVCWHSPWIGEPWPTGANNGITEKDNLVDMDPGFADEPFGVLTLGPRSPAQRLGCGVIPLDEIGLVRDATRATVPPCVRTALELGPPRGNGEPTELRLRLRNDGTDPARGTVVVETSTSASSEHFDYALAPGEVLTRDLTVRADDRTVRIYSPDSRLQPTELVIPDPLGGESAE